MSIPDELERIAARAPEIVVPSDTWARARRARRRERLGVVAVVAVVLAVAGTLTWWPTRDGVDPVDGRSVGVPNRLWEVPERLSAKADEKRWASDLVTADVTEIGTGAAAWVTGWGLPVVVDATRGRYHLLDLPDLQDDTAIMAIDRTTVVALSPDGGRLAYGYAVVGPAAETEPVPTGVRVVDLTSGEVREIPVLGEEGTEVSRIVWSPDGTWLALLGVQQSWWTPEGNGTSEYLDGAGPVLGRIGPTSEVAEVRRIRTQEGALAVDDRGSVTFGFDRLRRWDGIRLVDVPGSPDRLAAHLGFLADGSRVRLASRTSWEAEAVRVVPVVGRDRRVLRFPRGLGTSLSLATDLMTVERPTVDRPEPDWPTDWGALAAPAAWLLGALVAGTFLIRPLRRVVRRRRGTTVP